MERDTKSGQLPLKENADFRRSVVDRGAMGVPMSGEAVFLTGATGALGSWIAQRALADGMDVRALARATASCSARQRVERSISAVTDGPLFTRLQVVEGDFLDEEIDHGRPSLVIHCAACTAFHERSQFDSHQTNVKGLQKILDICSRQRLPLVHISTAYVCGSRTGIVLENELDCGQRFNNVYERTKSEGESLVHAWSRQTGLPAIVIRPSIVLGDWARGLAVRFNTLYHLMAALDSVGPSLKAQRLRLVGSAEVKKNILPVDYFADVAWRIIRRGVPGTFHITHPDPISMGELGASFNRLFNIDLKFVTAQELDQGRATPVERMCNRIMAPYRFYMVSHEPEFDRRATISAVANRIAPPHKLDTAYFSRLLDYGRKVNWGRGEPAPLGDESDAGRISEYFEIFLADRTDQNLLPDLKRLTARFSISMKDHPSLTWWLDVQSGVLVSISKQRAAADCAYTLDSATFLNIASGKLPPQRAFFSGRIKISGDIELGLKVATVLAKFFAAYPFVFQPA